MNKNTFRLVFSAARGQVIAVSEIATASGKSASGEAKSVRPASSAPNRPLAPAQYAQTATKTIATALALLAWPVALQAQIVADPNAAGNLRPQILSTASGLPQVNIQTPSAAGVSRNVYRQFDVQANGAILNNSSGNVQTQLGGWIQGNGNLAGGSARVILNEVNSSNPSYLKGYVEVAGQRAEVVIANPSGISVDGGGFINASAVTLTTGTPVMNGGSLDSYRVQTGNISIDGAGLDTRTADYTRILARAAQVNAGIWAKDLTVVAGANAVNASTNAATPIAGTGTTPAFALDVAALGGMYAGKITLVGTEAGVGVNNAGTIAANGGDLVLSVNGMLTNRGVMDGQTTAIQADTLRNTGTGRIYGDHVALQADSVDNSAETVGGVTRAAVIAARDRLDIGAQTLSNSEHALILSAGDMSIGGALDSNNQATGSATTVRNGSATIEAMGNLSINATTLINANDHFAYGEQLISTQNNITESPWANYYRTFDRYNYEPVVTQDDPGQIIAGGNIALTGATITNQQSKIIAGGTLSISGTTIANTTVNSDRRVNDIGTQYSWGVTGGHDDCWVSFLSFTCNWVLDYGYVPSSYNVNTLTSTTVSQGVALPNASAGSVSTTVARSTVAATASTTSSTLASALFNTPTNPSATYLLETDARFTNQRSWLGSDYMLSALALDPAAVQKRLGDGFYEQRLIREQVGELTGRRFLANYTSDEAQYQALMNAGVTTARAFNLRPGIALTAEQVARLTSDIVWLVEQEVTLPDGHKERALVPQLYTQVRAGDLDASGALLSARSVQLAANGDVLNSGILSADQLGIAATNVNNTNGTLSARQLSIRTTGDISNTSGTITARQSLDMAAGGNITSSTATRQVQGANRTSLDRPAAITVTDPGGALGMTAGGDVNLTASQVQSAGTVQIAAAGSVNLGAATTTETFHREGQGDGNFRQHLEQSTQSGSSITGRDNLTITAGKDITGTAATIGSQADTTLNAGNNILLQAGQNTRSADLQWVQSNNGILTTTTTDTHLQSSSATAQRSTVAGQNISVIAGNTLASVGTGFQATDSLRVEGKEQTLLYETQDVQTSSTTTRSTTSLAPLGINVTLQDKTSTDSSASSTAIGTRLVSTNKIEVGVGTKTELRGAELQAQQIAFVQTDPAKAGELILGGSTNTTQTSHTEKTETLGLYQEQKGSGQTTQSLNQTTLKGNVQLDAALKITARIPDTAGGQTLKAQINALAGSSGNSGLEYLNTLAANPNVQWDKVALAHEKWSYDQAGLTPAGAALLSIAVAAYAPGLSTGITSAVGGGSVAAGLNAGFIALQSQAAVALVNNRGDIGKTLDQLGKEDSIKNLLTVMVAAGALSNLNQTLGFNGQSGPGATGTSGITSTQAANQFGNNLLKNITNNVAGAAIDSAINGKPLDEKALASALSSALITAGMAQGANAIGDSNLNAFSSKLAHATLGCAGGVAMGASCNAGALGAVVGELAAEYINPSADPARNAQTLAFAKTMAAAAGVIAGGGNNATDVNVAAKAGANAAENNHMLHPPETRLAKQLAANAIIKKADGTAYSAEEIQEQMRLMGNKVSKQALNKATVLIGSEAIVASLEQDPSLPKAIDGNTAVEKLGKPNAALQKYIIDNTAGALGWMPDTSPYIASVPLDKPKSQTTPVSVTAKCANGDTACITGIGQQQNAPLTQQTREAIADGASGLSRQAGVVAATATTVTTVAPPQVKPISGAVAVGATVIGVGADAVEQLVRPDIGQTGVNSAALIVQTVVEHVPNAGLVAPITNELVEAWKASGSSMKLQEWINQKFGAQK